MREGLKCGKMEQERGVSVSGDHTGVRDEVFSAGWRNTALAQPLWAFENVALFHIDYRVSLGRGRRGCPLANEVGCWELEKPSLWVLPGFPAGGLLCQPASFLLGFASFQQPGRMAHWGWIPLCSVIAPGLFGGDNLPLDYFLSWFSGKL